jgi:pheromone receptor transcription factor
MSDNHEIKDESNDADAGQYEGSDDDGDTPKPKGDRPPQKRAGRRKINIEFIKDKSRRHITFSKRKAGIMKKAYELSTLTGTQVLLLVASETGHVYTFATPKLQPLITKTEGKNLIQACLNAPDPQPMGDQPDSQDMGGMSQGLGGGGQQGGYGVDMDDQKKMRGDMKPMSVPSYQQQMPPQQMGGHPPSPSPQNYGLPTHSNQQLPSLQQQQGGMHNQYAGLDMPNSMYMSQQQNDYSPQGSFGQQNLGMGMSNRGGLPSHLGASQYGGSSGYGMNPSAVGGGMGSMDNNPHKVTIYGNPGAMRGQGGGLDQYYDKQ